MSEGDLGEITVYLKRLSSGDASAEAPLAEAVYAQLQRIARSLLNSKASDFSLEPTALVNTVLLELIRIRSIEWSDRVHFFRVASRLLRRRMIDYIREQRAHKRPDPANRVDMDGLMVPAPDRFEEILFVHDALEKLYEVDRSLADLIEMVYFGGVTIVNAAELRGVSEKTIDRQLDYGRRWMKAILDGPCPCFSTTSALVNEG